MTCRLCGQSYSASYGQPAPGGSNAPGVFFYTGLLCVTAAVVFHRTGHSTACIVALIAAALCVPTTAIAWFDCARGQVSAAECPLCKGRNTVYPWSL